MKGIRTIWAAVLLLLAWGCFKDGSLKTNYVLKPLSQTLSTDSYEPLDGVQAYAFAADTNLYTVASYEDALNGVISLKGDLSSKISAPTAVSCGETPWRAWSRTSRRNTKLELISMNLLVSVDGGSNRLDWICLV